MVFRHAIEQRFVIRRKFGLLVERFPSPHCLQGGVADACRSVRLLGTNPYMTIRSLLVERVEKGNSRLLPWFRANEDSSKPQMELNTVDRSPSRHRIPFEGNIFRNYSDPVWCINPPSITIVVPVMYEASSEAK